MATVAARFVGRRDDDGVPVQDALDLAFEDAEFGRIDQVVGLVDREKGRTNFFQVRSRIIIV